MEPRLRPRQNCPVARRGRRFSGRCAFSTPQYWLFGTIGRETNALQRRPCWCRTGSGKSAQACFLGSDGQGEVVPEQGKSRFYAQNVSGNEPCGPNVFSQAGPKPGCIRFYANQFEAGLSGISKPADTAVHVANLEGCVLKVFQTCQLIQAFTMRCKPCQCQRALDGKYCAITGFSTNVTPSIHSKAPC